MKLRNKKTGEIKELSGDYMQMPGGRLYSSLAELNEEWEDYEEPKKWWYIDIAGEVKQGEGNVPRHLIDGMKQIDNYFSSREEAEKAVEKLKAVKRLKDKGFKFKRWKFLPDRPGVWIQADCIPDTVEELDLLFGGEE